MHTIYSPTFLILGDVVVLALVTILGFITHGSLQTAGWRILTTFLPLLIAWLCMAVPARMFELEQMRDWRNLWKPFWGMIFASSMAAVVRGFWLGTPVLPIFVIVLSGIGALAILIWRALFWFMIHKVGNSHG